MSITIYGSGTIGGLVSGWPEDLTITTADLVDGAVTDAKITSMANTKVTGVMTAAQIASVANTQITGTMTAAQIASIANTQITGVITTAQLAATTGSGSVVLATSPTLVTPTISSLSSASATALTLQSAGTTAITVDTSQRIITPYQTAFIAKGLAAQTTYTSNQVVVFNTASYNVGSGYSTSTGRFTAPVAGLYSFTFQIYLNPGGTNAPLAIYVNGVMEIFFLQGVAIAGIGLATLISLAASDYVEVRVRNTVGATATIYHGGDHTQFTGRLLG